MKKILLIIIIFNSYFIFSQLKDKDISINNDLIILKNGNEFKGKLVSIDDDFIYFQINNKIEKYKKEEVNKIQFKKKRLYEDIKNVKEIKNKDIEYIWKESKKWKQSKEYNFVTLLSKTTIEFIDNTHFKKKILKAIKILNENGKEYSTDYFYYLKNKSKQNLNFGITILQDGNISTIDEEAINDEPIYNNYPHYDNLNRVKFGFKDIDIESIFVWEAEIESKYDSIYYPFLFEKELISSEPISKLIIEIITPEDIDLNYEIYNGLLETNKSTVKIKKEKKKNVYYYEQNNIKSYTIDEERIPSDDIIIPKIYFTIKDNWKNLSYRYYNEFFSNTPCDQIKNFAQNLTKNIDNEFLKVKEIYNYINRQINSTSISINNCRYYPLEEEQLLNKTPLNNLDKTYLFVKSLLCLNIDIKFYFYRSNINHSLIYNLPSLEQFDSVFCKYKYKDKEYLISFSNPNFSFGQIENTIKDSDIFEISANFKQIEKIDNKLLMENITENIYEAIINTDDSMKLKRTTIVKGINQTIYRNKRFYSKDEMDKWVKERAKNFGLDVTIESYKFINDLSDFDKDIIFEENYIINNFSFSSGENIKLFKLFGITTSARSVGKNNRLLPYDLGEDEKIINKYFISIPPEFIVKHIINSKENKNTGFEYYVTSNIENNKIIIDYTTIFSKKYIEPANYLILKKWIEERADLSKEWILIEKQ